jgi:hypothetical protein
MAACFMATRTVLIRIRRIMGAQAPQLTEKLITHLPCVIDLEQVHQSLIAPGHPSFPPSFP